MLQENEITTENLVIGAGIAGMTLALKLSKSQSVTMILKTSDLYSSNTWFAQGGIASVLNSKKDGFIKHIHDTKEAGANLCHADVVKKVVESGPDAIQFLIDNGVEFTSDSSSSKLHLTKEGGHSERRVVHSADRTGQSITNALWNKIKNKINITVLFDHMAIDLITSDKYASNFSNNLCLGAYVFDVKNNKIIKFESKNVFLCTGGSGKSYLYTTNPDSATGDGIAMAWRAGARIANLEFMQFHPTLFYHQNAKNFLISEALRGEGGVLVDYSGNEFMHNHHLQKSLAPRDIVARAIDSELKSSGASNVFLDIRHLGAAKIKTLFPTIYQKCLTYGVDITNEYIPVVPAAHYNCGGVVTDCNGKTNVTNLFAIGETACTGLHGANRLASNSLLEAVVFAHNIAEYILTKKTTTQDFSQITKNTIPLWNDGDAVIDDELVVLSHCWDEIRRIMWNYVGIVRSDMRLERALTRINVLSQEIESYYWKHKISVSLLEIRNITLSASLTIKCAMKRKESRGIHYNIDWPQEATVANDTIIS